jgi:hypothetical protein
LDGSQGATETQRNLIRDGLLQLESNQNNLESSERHHTNKKLIDDDI